MKILRLPHHSRMTNKRVLQKSDAIKNAQWFSKWLRNANAVANVIKNETEYRLVATNVSETTKTTAIISVQLHIFVQWPDQRLLLSNENKSENILILLNKKSSDNVQKFYSSK